VRRKPSLRACFDRIFKRASTGYATLDRLLRRLFRNKEGLPRVLERRKISRATVSEKSRDARDIMLGLPKTLYEIKIAVLRIRRRPPRPQKIPLLASLVTWPPRFGL
jgi:hypothetical protein